MKNILYKPIFHISLIIVLSLIGYSNSFHASFHVDDVNTIVDNYVIKDPKLLFDYQKLAMPNYPSTYVTGRYIGFLTFALNYKLHGLNVEGYHVFNLFIHSLNGILIYLFVLLTFRTSYFSAGFKFREIDTSLEPYFIALFVALLFISHPVQTQAVTYISQRFASMATTFYLCSFVMYVKSRLITIEYRSKNSTGTFKIKPVLYYVGAFISAVLAMKTKEIAFTLPVMILIYELLFYKETKKRIILYLFPLALTMLIIPLNLMTLDRTIGEFYIGDTGDGTKMQYISRLDYMFTQFRVIVTYLRLLFLPINQNVFYDYPIYNQFFSAPVILSSLILIAIFGLGVYLLVRSRRTASSGHEPFTRFMAFGIFWFFITLSLESSIIPLDIIFEHRLYLPSLGFFIFISLVLFSIIHALKGKHSLIPVALCAVIIISLTGMTYERNNVWQDALTLWQDVVSKSPDNVRGRTALGAAYLEKDQVYEAMQHLKIATKLSPDNAEAHYNLGVAYHRWGSIDNAIKHYELATKPQKIKVHPKIFYSNLYNNLGLAFEVKGQPYQAIKYLKLSLQNDFTVSTVHNNIGILYQSLDLIDDAVKHFEIATKLNPNYSDAYQNLDRAYMIKERRNFNLP